MQLRERNLELELTGDDVDLLQRELSRLGFSIAESERRRKRFGKSTFSAVEGIQHIFEEELRGEGWEGRFGIVERVTAALINRLHDRLVAQEDTPPNASEPAWRISGTVRDTAGMALVKATVIALDQDIDRSHEIGRAPSGSDGAFELAFDVAADRDGEAGPPTKAAAPDLRFEVVDHHGRPRPLLALILATPAGPVEVERIAPSADAPFIIVNAPRQAELRIEVGDTEGADGLSEFDEVEARLRPVLGDADYHRLREDEGRFQLSFLAAETGLRREIVERLVVSDRLALAMHQADRSVLTPAFYGLGHASLPLDLPTLSHQPRTALAAALRRAIDEDVIPRRLAREMDAVVDAILAAAVTAALADAGGTSAGECLSLAGLPPAVQQRLLRELADHDGPSEELWTRLAADPEMGGADKVRRAELALRLGTFTGSNLPLVRLLMAERGMRSAAETALIDESEWLSLVRSAGLPEALRAADEPGQAEAYARGLMRTAQAQFPTAAIEGITTRLHREFDIAAGVPSWLTAVRLAAERGAVPEFDLRRSHVDRFIDEHGPRIDASIEDAGRLRTDLKRLQRTLAIAGEAALMAPLLREQHDSAFRVAHVPLDQFVGVHAATLGAETAGALHAKALQIHSANLFMHMAVRDAVATAQMKTLGGTGAAELYDAVVKTVPSYADLFGATALCDCDHCESILSPAAYFVDLLQFLSRAPKNDKGRTPLDILLDRRPDLEHILLTCENSDTPIPAIDLVNEVLETMVALGRLDASAAHDTGNATADELAANPQYAVAKARDDIMAAVYPVNLPFDMRLETARAYLKAIGTFRHEVMTTLRRDALAASPDFVTFEAMAAEALGLSELDFELVTAMRFDGSGTAFKFADVYGLVGADVEPLLSLGSSGNAVRLLQQKLNRFGVGPIKLGSVFDAATEAGLKAFQTAVGQPPTGTTTPQAWATLEAIDPPTRTGLLSWVTEFMRRTERSYVDVVALCSTRTFNPFGSAIAALSATKVVWQDVADLAAGGFAAPNPAIVAGAADLGLSVPDFVAWLKKRHHGLAAGIVIESTGDGCDIAHARLTRVDGSVVSEETFAAINFFLRLADRTGLSIAELDCVLCALRLPDTMDANLVPWLAALVRLRQRLDLSYAELAVLHGYIETGANSLYSRLFLNRAALELDPSFVLALDGFELMLASETISGHVPALLAAFRLTAEELTLVRDREGLAGAADTLSIAALARLYRYPLLARALDIGVGDLLVLLTLSSPDPAAPGGFPGRPDQIERLVQDVDALDRTGLGIGTVDQILRHESHAGSGEPSADALAALSATLHDEQIDLAAELAAETGASIERFGILLARLVGPEAVDQLFGIAAGSASFTAAYGKVPAPAMAAALAPNVTFEPERKSVRFARRAMPAGSVVTLGALTDGEAAALKVAAAADIELVQAIGILHARPRRLVADCLSGLSGGAAVAAEIFASGPGARPVEDKFAYLAASLMPYVHDALAKALIKQRLLGLVAIDPPLLAALVDDEAILSAPGAGGPLVTSLRALERSGWSAEYFASTVPAGAPLATGEVPSLAFDGTGGEFGLPAPVGSARWSTVFLPRVAEPVVFEVSSNGTPALFWNGQPVPAMRTGTTWRFEARPAEARGRVELTIEWRRTAGDPAVLDLAWTSGTNPRMALPPRLTVPAVPFRQGISALVRLDKAARFSKAIEVEPSLLRHVTAHAPSFSGFSLDALPLARDGGSGAAIDTNARSLFRGALGIAALAALGRSLRGNGALMSILGAGSIADAAAAMAAAMAWDQADIALLLGPTGFNAGVPAIVDGRAAHLVRAAVMLIRRVGIDLADLLDFAGKPVDAAQLETVKRAVRAKFDEAAWLSLAEGVNNPLRERWRDALSSFLQIRLGLQNRNQLYELLFLDTEVASCVKTSRIRHGIFAVQTFVQRVQLNLHNFGAASPDTVLPTAIDPRIWQAKSQYRVQEAARKVFLWPELYMKETQRDDRTPLFDRLVGDLGQAEMTDDGVETAILTYLKGLDEIARLEICGTYAQGYDAGTREPVNVVHMIGRTTLGAPYSFFYRRLEEDRIWTPWERVPVDIDTIHDGKCEGAHVMPVIWNRRLHVFWPIMEEKPDGKVPAGNAMAESKAHREWRRDHDNWLGERDWWEKAHAKWREENRQYWEDKRAWEAWRASQGHSEFYPFYPPVEPKLRSEPVEPDSHDGVAPDLTHMEIRLAWSEYFDGRWSPKQVSSLVLTASEIRPERYVFQAVPLDDGSLQVAFFCRHYNWSWMPNAGPGGGLRRIGATSSSANADVGSWLLSDVSGKLKVQSGTLADTPGQSGPLGIVQPDHTDLMYNTFENKAGAAGLTFNIGDYLLLNARLISESLINARRLPLLTLTRTPSTYRVTAPHHYPQFVLQGPCFYRDFDRTYIATRVFNAIPRYSYVAEPNVFAAKPAITAAKFKAVSVISTDRDDGTSAPDRNDRIFSPTARPLSSSRLSKSSGKTISQGDFFNLAGGLTNPDKKAWTLPTYNGAPSGYVGGVAWPWDWQGVWFRNLFHPFISQFILRLGRDGIDGLLSISTQSLTNDGAGSRFSDAYQPTQRVAKPYPGEIVDFGESAYGVYNRELFFHANMLMADVWEGAGMMQKAERCLRRLFDPTVGTATAAPGGDTDIFWQYLPFRGRKPARIEDMMRAVGYAGTDPGQLALKAEIVAQITALEKDPFNPFLLGRMRVGAMQKYVVIRWLQHLVLRADLLLRSERPEPINEATQILVLAANIAGPRAERVPQRTRRRPESYHTLKTKLDRFSNALVLLENEFPFSGILPAPSPSPGGGLLGMSEALYFCIPPNEMLEALKDTIADRLFKIRHCMNLEGVVRELPLYEPPIDPALLVAARAQGLDLASVLSDLNAPRPDHRFEVVLERANQLVEDVRRLGKDLQGILEARDAEAMVLLRAEQDLTLLRDQIRQVKLARVDEAKARLDVLREAERLLSNVRIPHFMRQLGLSERPPPGTLAEANVLLNASESERISALGRSRSALAEASQYALQAKMMSAIPSILSGTAGTMSTPVLTVYFGGHMLSLGLEAFSKMKEQGAADASHQATLAEIRGEVERRAEQWSLELSSAVQEREQVDRQLLEARIGLDIAEFDLLSHDRETGFAADRLEFQKTKPTAPPHHDWLKQEVGLLLGQYYQLAFDECKRLQQIYRFDTCDPAANFVEFGYFDKAHHGLLAGERLGLALRKMERAYRDHELNLLALSRPVSLALIEPMALIALKATGSCEFSLTEALFDQDFPGHFRRRIRRVAVTIPCVTGPYATVNATLTLLNARVRTTAVPSPDYAERPDDPRFVYHHGVMRSIATSSANEDTGTVPEPAARRHGPFEGYGAISRWRLELPHDTNAFDPETITDVILRVEYDALPGGQAMQEAARRTSIAAPVEGAGRLLSLRHEFADAWHRGLQPLDAAADHQLFSMDIDIGYLPFGMRRRGPKATGITVFLQVDDFVAYQAGVPLQGELTVTTLANGAPSGPTLRQNVILSSVPNRIGGLPMASMAVTSKVPIRVEFKVASADVALINSRFVNEIGTGPAKRLRINGRTVRDLGILVSYDTTS